MTDPQKDSEHSTGHSSASAPNEGSELNALEIFKQSLLQGVKEMVKEGFSELEDKIEAKFATYEKLLEGIFFRSSFLLKIKKSFSNF